MFEDRIALSPQFRLQPWYILAIKTNPPQVECPRPVIALAEPLAQVEQAGIALAHAKCSPLDSVPHLATVDVMEHVADAIPLALMAMPGLAPLFTNPSGGGFSDYGDNVNGASQTNKGPGGTYTYSYGTAGGP